MGFFRKIASATVKTALSPLVAVKEGTDIIRGKEGGATSKLFKSIENDIDEAFEDIA